MLAFGTEKQATRRRRVVRAMGIDFGKAEWMECGTDAQLSPTISLIEQPPRSVLAAHFHRNNQFQLFVGGGGFIGRTPIEPVTIHYAGAYTGYGPLVAGDEGIRYFTIRPVCEAGAHAVATARDLMVRGPKRHATSAPVQVLEPTVLASLSEVQRDDVITHAPDGLGATVVAVPPADVIPVPWVAAADGMFLLVLAGTLEPALHAPLSVWESIFVSHPQELPMLRAGPRGAQIVCAFVPAKADAYRQVQAQETRT
ncbi:hypothetical protein [Pseudorhodoferax soli]|uniref:Uncharacterized protein n=1 Tax=Pseudorhodoferax soli TaxID=545864 RepID=A0A368XL77_9BURK|nr:hypothetical protein [Pseudorhodoferax soli]RCW68605.1 hypothetical protein DES41_107126 [Pseudorhodoferax soli]